MKSSRGSQITRRQMAIMGGTAGLLLCGPRKVRAVGQMTASKVMPGLATLSGIQREDGSAGAVPGVPAARLLLQGYRARPGWKVAGVDYVVGCPPVHMLRDWRTLQGPNIEICGNCVRTSGIDTILTDVDFSIHGGARIYSTVTGSVTVRNSRFGGNSLKSATTGIIDVSCTNLTVQNCDFDGAGDGVGACILFVRQPVTATVQYNHFDNFPSRVVQLSRGGTLDYRFNLIGEGALQAGAHMNYLELGEGEARLLVAFNTTAQTARARSAGEGFQFYFNGGGVLNDAVCVNNTMIARGGNGEKVMSYLLHGSGYESGVNTTVAGRAIVKDNYMDCSGAYGPFYGRSFLNWEFGENTDMVLSRQIRRPD